MDEESLMLAVRRLKIENPKSTAKEVFDALDSEGANVELSVVKKACGKVTKALAKEPPPVPAAKLAAPSAEKPSRKERRAKVGEPASQPPESPNGAAADELAEIMRLRMSNLPPLVKPNGTVAFLCCQVCEKPVAEPSVCSGCHAVCYCSQMCQLADAVHEEECAAYARHMSTDVRVRLDGDDPEWLKRAMDHRCDETWCDLIERMGVHDDDAYGLICGCTMPGPSPRMVCQVVPDETETANPANANVAPLSSWAEYYRTRARLPPESPLALLLSWPLTVYLGLSLAGLTHVTEREVVVHYLGPEKEVMILPLFAELAFLCPAVALRIEMIGPLGIALPPPALYEGSAGGHVNVSVRRGLYHELDLPRPDLAVAPNAGLAIEGYGDRWPLTLRHLAERNIPFVFTDYSEQSMEKGLAFAARRCAMPPPTIGVTLNPFRAPMRLPMVHGGSVGFPTLSNGFYAAFNLPMAARDATHTPTPVE